MKNARLALLALAFAAFAAAGGAALFSTGERPEAPSAQVASLTPEAGVQIVDLPEERKAHILENHRHGAGKACKSEFPAGWSDEKILSALEKLAANDNIPWKQEDNGYHVGEQDVEGLRLRVVLNREENILVTGYPVNVERNPCTSSRSLRQSAGNGAYAP